MSLENPVWGATKIHGERLKLGIEKSIAARPSSPTLSDSVTGSNERSFRHTQATTKRKLFLSAERANYRFFFFAKITFQLSL
jgi:hypothetical protein